MKKIAGLIIAICLLGIAGNVWGAGSCVVTAPVERIRTTPGGEIDRVYVTLTCTGDGSIAAYSLNPAVYGVKGWWLYSVTTNPGTSAPTAAYDITLMVDGEDIAGGLLGDRSAANTETVAICPTTKGYPMVDGTIVVTHANNTANPSTIVEKFRFMK